MSLSDKKPKRCKQCRKGLRYKDGVFKEGVYQENEDILRWVVCHELLHNWIREEDVVRDIDDFPVCYYD